MTLAKDKDFIFVLPTEYDEANMASGRLLGLGVTDYSILIADTLSVSYGPRFLPSGYWSWEDELVISPVLRYTYTLDTPVEYITIDFKLP